MTTNTNTTSNEKIIAKFVDAGALNGMTKHGWSQITALETYISVASGDAEWLGNLGHDPVTGYTGDFDDFNRDVITYCKKILEVCKK